MKGQECSWADMRKVQKALKGDSLPGVVAALKRCVSKGAISNWRRSIELMEVVQISELEHVSPSHGQEIVRRVKDREQWLAWAQKCEKEEWTVVELRAQLRGIETPDSTRGRVLNTYLNAIKRFLEAIRRVQEMPERLSARIIRVRHAELRDALAQLEQALAAAKVA